MHIVQRVEDYIGLKAVLAVKQANPLYQLKNIRSMLTSLEISILAMPTMSGVQISPTQDCWWHGVYGCYY